MKKQEILKILHYLNTYYNKRFELPENKNKLKMIVNTWEDFLAGYNYKLAKTAMKKLIARKEWPPTPGEVVQEIEQLTSPDEDKLTAGEAWVMVVEAIRKHSYLYNPEKVREVLPDRALRAAEVVGLNLISKEGRESYVMNTYLKVYKSLKDKNREYEMIPSSMRKEVEGLSNKFRGTPQIEGEVRENESND